MNMRHKLHSGHSEQEVGETYILSRSSGRIRQLTNRVDVWCEGLSRGTRHAPGDIVVGKGEVVSKPVH